MKSNPLIGFIKVAIFLLILLVIGVNLTYPIFYNKYVEEYSQEYGVDKYLVYSIIRAESNFNKDATSEKNAKGLMQVLEDTAQEIFDEKDISADERNLYIPKNNIMAGTYYVRKLLDRYDNNELKAIAAYNSGMAHVDRWSESDSYNFRDNIDFNETKNYVNRVESNKKIYKFLYETLNLRWTSLPDYFAKFGVLFRNFIREIKRSVG